MTLDPTLPVLGRAVPNGTVSDGAVSDSAVSDSAGPNGGVPGDAVSSDRATVARQWRDRRALERRLHDGAALRISALALRLGLLRHALAAGDREFDAAVEALQDELHLVLQELRDVEGRLYPPLLDEAGIGPALREAAARCPVPVHVDATEDRYGPAAEGAAYFALLGCLPQPRRCPDGGPVGVREGGRDGAGDGGLDGGLGGDAAGREGRDDGLAVGAPVGVVVRRDGDALVMLVTGVDACHAGTVDDEVRLLGGTVRFDTLAVGGAGPVSALMTVRIPCA